jgi:hypothetical protein
MDEDWAKRLADKIETARVKNESLDQNSARIVKFAEIARGVAADMLFGLFIDRLDAIRRHLQPEVKSGLFGFLRKSPPSVLDYTVTTDLSFRFQHREAIGKRLEIEYRKGAEPKLTIDVATSELIQGEYFPIFRETGAIAGAQIWQQRLTEGKHPNLVSRLFLILSLTALDEGLKVEDAVSWIYEEDERPFNSRSIEELIESLIASA